MLLVGLGPHLRLHGDPLATALHDWYLPFVPVTPLAVGIVVAQGQGFLWSRPLPPSEAAARLGLAYVA